MRRRHVLGGVAFALAVGTPATRAAPGPVTLTCRLALRGTAHAGGPALLEFALTNEGRTDVRVLAWGTPFEGWRAPYAALSREGEPLPYQGPQIKRGDPARGDYLRIAPGKTRTAVVDLAAVFDIGMPGRYRIEPAILLHDVIDDAATAAPRPRAKHVPMPLACAPAQFDVVRATRP